MAIPRRRPFLSFPLQVGIAKGIFAKYGLEIESVALQGSGKLHQAMAADALDIGLGSGPDLAYIAKGAPELGVAQMAGPPLFLGVTVPYASAAKTADDLKGKRVSVSAGSGVTRWLMLKLEQQKGWGPDGLVLIAAGGDWPSQVAALTTGQVDAAVTAVALGLKLEETKQGRLLFLTSDIVHDFIQHVIFASDRIIRDNPDALRRFLKAWFETIAFMRANKAEAVDIARSVTQLSRTVESQEYDLVMPMFSVDGRFEAAGLKTIRSSFVELGVLDREPDMSTLYTEAFLPGQ